jgi:hypothetical protein
MDRGLGHGSRLTIEGPGWRSSSPVVAIGSWQRGGGGDKPVWGVTFRRKAARRQGSAEGQWWDGCSQQRGEEKKVVVSALCSDGDVTPLVSLQQPQYPYHVSALF